MTKRDTIQPIFVDRIPKVLDEGFFYISQKYGTAAHNCCCGCGTKIMTPIKPGRWRIEQIDGAVSLSPSVGNWSAGCQSHYWIEENRICWARAYTEKEIAANRASDSYARQRAHTERARAEQGFWRRLLGRIKSYWDAL